MDHFFGELDTLTAREAFAGPGQDTRQWITFGTVVPEDPEQPSVEMREGCEFPMVTCKLHPSALLVSCRVASYVAGNGEGEWFPFVEGDECLIAVPNGDERDGCVIIGRLNNNIAKWPRTVAGQDTTTNKLGFMRLRTPYILETSSSYLLRSAITGAFLGIKDDGSILIMGSEKGVFNISADGITLQTGTTSKYSLQLNSTDKFFMVDLDQTAKFVLGEDMAGLVSGGPVTIQASGVPAVEHVATVEGYLNFFEKWVLAMNVALTAPPYGPAPLTGASLAALFLPITTLAAVAAAGTTALTPLMLGASTSALTAKVGGPGLPSIGSPGLLTG